jgi:purine-cytosine permease-like protein
VQGIPPQPVPSIPDAPVFLEPTPPVAATSTDIPGSPFDTLLSRQNDDEKIDAPPSTWPAPEAAPSAPEAPSGEPLPAAPEAPSGEPLPAEPAVDPEPAGRRPFGEGVERDDAVDPSDSIFGAGLAPIAVDTAGVAIAAAAVIPESAPILIQREPLEPEPELVPPRVFSPEAAGQEPTPLEQRVGRAARLFWLWFAPNSSVVAVAFGGMVFALGLSLRQAIIGALAGVAISILPLGVGTLAGKRSGQPTMVVSRATFGVLGNILPAVVALLSRLFWAAALLWLFGAGLADIATGAQLTDGLGSSELTLIFTVIGFVLAIVIAFFGYALIAKLQLVASIVSAIFVVGFIALTYHYVNVQTALTTGDSSWVLAVTAAVLVFSFVGLAWANSGSDLARYQRVGSSGALSAFWAALGTALPSFVLIAYGALLTASDPRIAAGIASDPLDSLGRLLPVWYPVPMLIATGLSLLSGVVLAMYSGGFALQAVGVRLRRTISTVIIGLVVVVLAILVGGSITDFSQLFRDFATTVAVPIAAWTGLFGAELMIRRRRFDSVSLLGRGGVYASVRWANLIAFVVITVLGLGLLSASVSWLSWEGFLFPALGVSSTSEVAATDLGVLVALALGLLFPIVAGIPAIRRQERSERAAE